MASMGGRKAANQALKLWTVSRVGRRGRPEAAAGCGVPKSPPVAGWLAPNAAPVAAPNRPPEAVMPPAAELDCPKAAAEPNKPAEQPVFNTFQGARRNDGSASATPNYRAGVRHRFHRQLWPSTMVCKVEVLTMHADTVDTSSNGTCSFWQSGSLSLANPQPTSTMLLAQCQQCQGR